MTQHKYLLWTLCLLLSMGSTTRIWAQQQKATPNNFTEGIITYEIKVEGMPELAEFLRETTLSLYLKDGTAKFDLRIMGGFSSMQLLSSADKQQQTALMDIPMLSEKVAIALEGDDDIFRHLNAQTHVNQTPREFGQVTYFHNETRRIAGRTCYRAELPIAGTNEKVVLYLAKKMKMDMPELLASKVGDLDGLPLSIELQWGDMRVTLTAKDVKRCKLESVIFDVPSDYSEKTIKEFKHEIEDAFGGTRKEAVGL